MQHKTIEGLVSGMLTTSQAKKMNVEGIQALNKLVTKAERSKLTASINLGSELNAKSEEIDAFFTALKNKAKDLGLPKPTLEDVFTLVYGLGKSWVYKVKKAALNSDKLPLFLAKCDETEKEGKTAVYSIEAFNTWCLNFETHKGEAETDKESISGMKDKKADALNTIISVKFGSLSFKLKGLNGLPSEHETDMNAEEINQLLTMLNQYVKSTFATQIGKAETKKLSEIMQKKVAPKKAPTKAVATA
jgi:hypothetical protein